MTDQVKLSTLKPGDRFEFNCAIWKVDNNEDDDGWVGVHALGDMRWRHQMWEDTLVVQVEEEGDYNPIVFFPHNFPLKPLHDCLAIIDDHEGDLEPCLVRCIGDVMEWATLASFSWLEVDDDALDDLLAYIPEGWKQVVTFRYQAMHPPKATFTEAQEALIREALKGRLSNQEILQKMGLKP